MPKICPKCHAQNRDEAAACLSCGHRMTVVEQAASAVRYCPAGKHPMDPAWPSCPYCSGSETTEQSPVPPGRRRTEVEAQPKEFQPTEVQPAAIEKPAEGPKRRGTRFGPWLPEDPTPLQARPAAGQASVRRMVAVAVTYTWRPEGEVFPVYERRNYNGQYVALKVPLTAGHLPFPKLSTVLY